MCSLHGAEGARVAIRFKGAVNFLVLRSAKVNRQITGTANPSAKCPSASGIAGHAGKPMTYPGTSMPTRMPGMGDSATVRADDP